MSGGSQTILVVEDSDDDFYALTRAFRKSGLRNAVHRCSNGDQAVDYLFRRGAFSDPETSPRPGVVLLDLNLPGLDGRDVLKAVKADPDLRKIPVIVLTTSRAEQDIEGCYAQGANTYIQKPVDLKGFFQAIARLKDYWYEVAILPRGGDRSGIL